MAHDSETMGYSCIYVMLNTSRTWNTSTMGQAVLFRELGTKHGFPGPHSLSSSSGCSHGLFCPPGNARQCLQAVWFTATCGEKSEVTDFKWVKVTVTAPVSCKALRGSPCSKESPGSRMPAAPGLLMGQGPAGMIGPQQGSSGRQKTGMAEKQPQRRSLPEWWSVCTTRPHSVPVICWGFIRKWGPGTLKQKQKGIG